MNFLDLFNQVARVARPAHNDLAPLTSLNQQIKDSDLDSLDTLVLCMYMTDLYGIDESLSKEMLPQSPQELLDFLNVNKTKEPASLEEAMGLIQ